jgi:Flp pilus assembly protein TadD
MLAAQARMAGDTLTASSLYRQILTAQPEDVEAQLGLAGTLLDEGDIDGAKPVAAQLFERAPRNDRVLALMARIDIADGDLATAAARLALAGSFAPESRDILLVRGVFEDMRGDHLAAQQAYRQALAVAPGDLSVEVDLALSLTASGDLDGAARILEPLAKGDAPARIRHNLALVYGLQGREAAAKALLAPDMPPDAVASNLKFYRTLRLSRTPSAEPGSMMPLPQSGAVLPGP